MYIHTSSNKWFSTYGLNFELKILDKRCEKYKNPNKHIISSDKHLTVDCFDNIFVL